MTTNEKVARRKLSLLKLAKELNNVTKPASSSATVVSSSTKFAVITRPMAPRACSTNCPAVKGLIPTGSHKNWPARYQCRWGAWRVATARLALQTRPLVAPRENPPGADNRAQ